MRAPWHRLGLPHMHVRVFPAAEVTSRNADAEVDPREAGLARPDVEAMWTSVERLYATGLHPAIALCVRRRGKVVVDRAIGHVRGNGPDDFSRTPKTPVRHDSLFSLYSASKAITAMVVHLLDERGLVHLDDSVVEYVPEFGKHGKEWITLRHILTHRAGIPTVPGTKFDLDLLADPERVVQILCDARPLSVPGRRITYHALTGGYVIGEVVRRVTGRDIRRFLREEVLDPLGFDTFGYGVPAARIPEVAENAYTGAPAVPPYRWLVERGLGVSVREAARMSNDPRFLSSII
ncbi:MAG: class A beta-lactamase-related serine hydrolase, partial [Thermoleophilia bacterium]|nr:class A beta-lactamase-related serine hydrolase [Thermoleophilia bacterium]